MSNSEQSNLPAKGQFLVYMAEDGRTKLEVRLENETVWLTQQHIAELFQTTIPNVSMHLKGFVLDDERLKNPDHPFDYFDELLRRIQDIRTSERLQG